MRRRVTKGGGMPLRGTPLMLVILSPALTCKRMYAGRLTYVHARTYTRAHIRYTRAYTHIHVHAHTRTRAYTYTHTHIVRAMIVAMINGNALECPCTGG